MKKREEKMPVSVEPVKLKPLLGMEPGLYLTILYTLIILVVVFLVAFLPGILKGGKRVMFVSSVHPSVVRVNGTYIGSTPVEAWIDSGNHEATFIHDGASSGNVTFEVSHPVFLTWLFPRRQTVESGELLTTISAFRNYLRSQFDQLVAWSAVIDFDDHYHRPPLFVQAANTAVHTMPSGGETDLVEFFTQGINHITSSVMADDYEASLHILTENNLLPTRDTDALIAYISRVKPLFSDTPARFSNGSLVEAERSPRMKSSLKVPLDGVQAIEGFSFAGGSTLIGRKDVTVYPGIHEKAIETTVSPFSIASSEVTEYLWALFMRDNPYWAKSNIEELMVEGLVDERYLAGLYPAVAVPSRLPIRNISWYAAEAFVQWLSAVTGKTVFLPSQNQWEYAAQADADLSSMGGDLWEFTSDSFAPLERFTGITSTWESEYAPVIVKGGSSVSETDTVDRASIGVLGRSVCSETAGIRIAWLD